MGNLFSLGLDRSHFLIFLHEKEESWVVDHHQIHKWNYV